MSVNKDSAELGQENCDAVKTSTPSAKPSSKRARPNLSSIDDTSIIINKDELNDANSAALVTFESRILSVINNKIQMLGDRLDNIESRCFTLDERSDQMYQTTKALTDEVSSFSSSIEALKKENEMLIIACNNNEQYSRKSNIRIFGLDETNQENCKQKVIGFIHNKLHLKDITSNDIDVAHPVGPISRVKTRPMLVKLHNRDQKMSILTARKQRKHSGLSVAEDLTKKMLNF